MQYPALLLGVLLFAAAAPAAAEAPRSGPHADAPRPVRAAPVLEGAWKGHWETARARGSAELIVTPERDPSRIVGQFTFMEGAKSWTARREGVVIDDRARFELPGGGEIVVRASGADELTGEFTAPSGLPAPSGTLVLTRVR